MKKAINKKRLIAVCYIGGRVGSSLTMGLLQLSGIEVGNIGSVKDHNNANGYYEINDYFRYCQRIIPELKGFLPMVRYIPKNIKIAKKHKKDFTKNIRDWIPGNFIAIKCPYYFPTYLFPKNYKVTIISLRRNLESQSKSIEHLNTSKGDFKQWLIDWQVKIDKYFKNDIEIYYEDWVNKPFETYLRLCEVVKPPKTLSEYEVNKFIDPKLKHY